MDTDEMLKWLYRNCDQEKLGTDDYMAVTNYVERSCAGGADYDTTVLLEKSRDHIRMIFKQFGV